MKNDQKFQLTTPLKPQGDQGKAIQEIVESFRQGHRCHTLMGVTGSGKTFTVANVIAKMNCPALIIAPNKTLAAQLFTELRSLFSRNSVHFFISYYDYYQPEAYVVSTDTYIKKDSAINDDIDKMRHEATRALFEQTDVIIVASVSCIYGLGSPDAYSHKAIRLTTGEEISRKKLLRKLIELQYSRHDKQLERGCFRVRGELIDILPAHQKEEAIRVEFFGDEIENISIIDVSTGKEQDTISSLSIYPNSHYVTDHSHIPTIIKEIQYDLGLQLRKFKLDGKLVEMQRLEQRIMQDIEAFEELGYCSGVENYARYLTRRKPGEAPPTLLEYFPKNFITIIDESHITIPQLRGMYSGDRARKQNLVDFGFRLPSALDNRPLNFEEFKQLNNRLLFVSATPAEYELSVSGEQISRQIIRPTGLLDPPIHIYSATNQVDQLYDEIQKTIAAKERVLIITLTKRMAEDLSQHYKELGVRVRYLHADIESLERVELLRGLRRGDFDVLIGINLLREGLDLPEVRLVAIMDADQQGFLRSKSSLIQMTGRAARNSHARVIFFADKLTSAMSACISETDYRRQEQKKYNHKHGIIPQTVYKELPQGLREIYQLPIVEDASSSITNDKEKALKKHLLQIYSSHKDFQLAIKQKTKQMKSYAARFEFEKAATLRDEMQILKKLIDN